MKNSNCVSKTKTQATWRLGGAEEQERESSTGASQKQLRNENPKVSERLDAKGLSGVIRKIMGDKHLHEKAASRDVVLQQGVRSQHRSPHWENGEETRRKVH